MKAGMEKREKGKVETEMQRKIRKERGREVNGKGKEWDGWEEK